jgi:hypothetical protein
MLQFSVGGILQGLLPRVQLISSIIGWVFGTFVWDNGRVSCYMWNTLPYLYHLFIILSCQYLICLSWKHLQKFNVEELVNMPTCNLSKITIHNIWLHQSRKTGGCLYLVIFDDYVHAFKQNALYKVYLNGGRCKKGPNKVELQLQWTSQSSDLLQMAIAIAKYTTRSSFTTRTLHLEGQKNPQNKRLK